MNNEIKPSAPETEKTDSQGKIPALMGKFRRQHWEDYAFIIAFVIILVITASMSDVFFTQRNLSNVMRQSVTNGLLSLGMLIVILTGGIDLSVGPTVALTGIIVAGL